MNSKSDIDNEAALHVTPYLSTIHNALCSVKRFALCPAKRPVVRLHVVPATDCDEKAKFGTGLIDVSREAHSFSTWALMPPERQPPATCPSPQDFLRNALLQLSRFSNLSERERLSYASKQQAFERVQQKNLRIDSRLASTKWNCTAVKRANCTKSRVWTT